MLFETKPHLEQYITFFRAFVCGFPFIRRMSAGNSFIRRQKKMGRARLPFCPSLQNAKKSRAASFARMQ
jgi:hypothetical protein